MAASHTLNGYGCTGQNRSPALEWRGAPKGTKSFAITMFDMDEHGSPSGWWHWVVYNVPGTTSRLPENAGAINSSELPTGAVQGRPAEASGAMVTWTAHDYTLAKATLTARWGR